MKHGSNPRRSRSRGNGKRSPSKNSTFESNGPEVKVRGTAQQVLEKYLSLARDASSAGDRILSEGYFQFAEHYYRILNADGGGLQNDQGRGEHGHGRDRQHRVESEPPSGQGNGTPRNEGVQDEGTPYEGGQNGDSQNNRPQNEGAQSRGGQNRDKVKTAIPEKPPVEVAPEKEEGPASKPAEPKPKAKTRSRGRPKSKPAPEAEAPST
ncbi:MAG: DUF4167 domain-containing protein [Rhodospirillales bacterium]|nr:DUF4167 domain-containing protein [Rhodospirillales bacterium]